MKNVSSLGLLYDLYGAISLLDLFALPKKERIILQNVGTIA